MDALNFLKFWRHATMATSSSSTVPHLVVETDSESDEEDSFFDLELTVHDFDNKENNNSNNKKNEGDPDDKTVREIKGLSSKHGLSKTAKSADDSEVDVFEKTALSMSPNESISKRKVLPIEPISKPQSPIAILRSAPSFRIFMFRKHQRMEPQKTQEVIKGRCDMGRTPKQHQHQQQKKKETKVFAVKLNVEEFHHSPTLSRDNSSRSYGSKLRYQTSEETKSERFSKDVLQKYLKLIKPLYDKVSKRYSDKVKFSGEPSSSASPMSSPSVASVSSRKEKLGSFPAGIRVVSKHLGKNRSSSTVTGASSPANRSDDTLLQQHDGIQSAILHCKRSFNSRDSSITLSAEGPMHSLRNSFEGGNGESNM